MTLMEIVRHLPNDRASAKIKFILTDEESQNVVNQLDKAERIDPESPQRLHFLKFTDAKAEVHYYPMSVVLYAHFVSNYEPPVPDKEEKTGE